MQKSLLENKKLIAITIAVCSIIIISIIMVKTGVIDFDRPEGVGLIGSDHAHAKIGISLPDEWLDLHLDNFPQYSFANDYIFLDDINYNQIHRVAYGATLSMFLEGLGMQFTDDCFIINDDVLDVRGNPYPQNEFCNDGEMRIKLYVNNKLVEENGNYIIKDQDAILITYDDKNTPTRGGI